MYKRIGRLLFLFSLLFLVNKSYAQQDVDFHINAQLLPGKKILKVKRDFYDPYLWVLAQNNEVFRVNSLTLAIDDFTGTFTGYGNLQFIDIAGRSQDTVFIATNSTNVIEYKKGLIKDIAINSGLTDTVTSIGMANAYGYYTPQNLLIGTKHGLGTYIVNFDSLNYFKYNNYIYSPIEIFSATYRTEMLTGNNYYYYYPTYYPIMFSTYFQSFAYDIRHSVESGNKINTALDVPVGVVNSSVYDGSFFWGNENGLYQESLGFSGQDPNDFVHLLTGTKVNKIADIFGLTSFYQAYNPVISKDNLLIGTDSGFYFSSSLMDKFVGGGIAGYTLFHYDPLGNTVVNDICVNATATDVSNIATGCENGVWLATNDGLYLLN
ncbi:MAG: hypothetical protein NVSMB24_18920 [Mucilaginibacter sp.]